MSDGLRVNPTHRLELIEPYFTDMAWGHKRFEVRREREDRRFEVGDTILFVDQFDEERAFLRTVIYVLRDMEWYGLPEDIVVLGLRDPTPGAK